MAPKKGRPDALPLEKMPELGNTPIPLTVKLPPMKQRGDPLGDGLRELYRRGDLCDVSIICAERTFCAHRVVLAAQSPVFLEGLGASAATLGAGEKAEVRLTDIANPEAVKFMLDHLYQCDVDVWADYNPRTQEINKDVLRLAENFRLDALKERATHWMARDLTTGNVVERLTICDEFNLEVLKSKILEQLTYNRRAMAEVANSPQIMNHPALMQAMLQLAANVPDREETPPKKRARK
mmetsp:Transcript_5350/g.14963  ORF Transcript_5350/g.14963 Transcript_5350/m.14963 type:complete len:238 (-) Transcript_5350:405-1118(-)